MQQPRKAKVEVKEQSVTYGSVEYQKCQGKKKKITEAKLGETVAIYRVEVFKFELSQERWPAQYYLKEDEAKAAAATVASEKP